MGQLSNSEVISAILNSLYAVAGRRTTHTFAATVIGSIIKTLEPSYSFFKYIRIDDKGQLINDTKIAVSPEIDEVEPERIGKAIEALVRIVYMDLIGKAGLFFITELKRNAGGHIITELQRYGVNLASLQVEQHYLYRSRERKKSKSGSSKKPFGDVSLLGYTWKNVKSWKYDPNKKSCVLYDENGEVLDNLNLDNIIEDYVKNLTDSPEDLPEEFENEINITDKEFELLKMLNSRDMDAETAIVLLHINKT